MLDKKWIKTIVVNSLIILLIVISLTPAVEAHRRKYRHHHRPSKTKNIAIGTAIGAIGGGLIGGRKGLLIGAGAGAGTGYGVYKYKQRKHKQKNY